MTVRQTRIFPVATIYCESESKRLRCYAGKDITSAVRRMPISPSRPRIDRLDDADGEHLPDAGYPRRFGLIERSRPRKLAERALAKTGADIDPDLRIQDSNGKIAGCDCTRAGD